MPPDLYLRTPCGKNEPTLTDLHNLERAKRLVEQELAKQLEEERRNEDQNKDLYELKKKKAKMQGDMIKDDNTARSSTMDKERKEKRHRMTKQPRDIEIKLDEVREQKQAEQQTQLEEMEEELQQIKDQKVQTRKTQFERDLAAKEKLREGKRHVIAKQLRDNETELDEERKQKQAKQRMRREKMKGELQQTKDQNKDI